jgi:hypothetical protein
MSARTGTAQALRDGASVGGTAPALRGGAMSVYRLTLLLVLVACFGSTRAAAQAEPIESPARYLATLSLGAPLRLVQEEDFGQDLPGPLFTDLFAGYVFSSAHRFRHGFGLGLSVNLSDDGGYAEPVYAGEQLTVMAAYMLYADLGLDVFGKAHLGVPIAITGGTTAGVELAASLGYRLLAGLGAFAELFTDVFAGSGSRLHPTVGLELGLFVDYEALP